MKGSEYFLIILAFLLVVSVSSAQLSGGNYTISSEVVTDGGGNLNSSSYNSSIVVGIISGTSASGNYTNSLGVFYALANVAPYTPNVTINSSTGSNKSSDSLYCSGNIYDDGDTSLTAEVRWYLNGALNSTYSYGALSDGNFSAVLTSGNISKNQNWSCGMRVYDGSLYGDWGYSGNITILNSLPVVTLSYPIPGSMIMDRTPTFNWTAIDADGDELTYNINITSYDQYGNFSALDNRYEIGIANEYYTPSTDLLLLSDSGYYYIWKVRANDGDGNGDWSTENNFSVGALVSCSLLANEVYFGNLLRGESNNTDSGLNPFVIENDGTALINISLNFTPIWSSIITPSPYYQFKADNDSTESNSFSWLGSIINWTDVSFSGFVVAIDSLKYADSSDTAEIDINVTVPSDEDFGIKNATVIFKVEVAE